jgi:hypothetical protein
MNCPLSSIEIIHKLSGKRLNKDSKLSGNRLHRDSTLVDWYRPIETIHTSSVNKLHRENT